jgi:hypothetical protein
LYGICRQVHQGVRSVSTAWIVCLYTVDTGVVPSIVSPNGLSIGQHFRHLPFAISIAVISLVSHGEGFSNMQSGPVLTGSENKRAATRSACRFLLIRSYRTISTCFAFRAAPLHLSLYSVLHRHIASPSVSVCSRLPQPVGIPVKTDLSRLGLRRIPETGFRIRHPIRISRT